MGDTELLNHYNLTTLEPAEWPAEKDEEFISEDETPPSRPKYASLERGPSLRESVPGSQRSKDGVQNLVQKDEPDPLGSGNSVMQLLQRQGLRVNDDIKTRNQFLLSSTTFSPTLYLSQAHSYATTDELLRGLDFLSNSIEKKSASLKVLVESNFERFVKAKATIDNVYLEMRKAGMETVPEKLPSPTSIRRPRSSSNQPLSLRKRGPQIVQPPPAVKTFTDERRKNALVKDTEYGVQGLRVPLNEAASKAEEVWGPALGGREREENLKSVLTSIERNRAIFDVGIALDGCIKAHDFGGVASNYAQAHKFAVDAKNIADRAKQNDIRLSDGQLQQILITSRVWMDVRNRIDAYKREIWNRLSSVSLSTTSMQSSEDEDLELVSLLLNLGVEDNPITLWLRNRIEYFKSRISTTFDRARVELEITRRKLANGRKTSPKMLATYLRNAGRLYRKDRSEELDSPQIISFWEKVCGTSNSLLSPENGLLGEVIEFTDTLQSFIDGKKQRTMPIGIDGQSRKHHRLDPAAVQDLQAGAMQLFNLVQQQIRGLLVEAPLEDISTLLNSVPPTPATPSSASLSPTRASRSNFKPEDVPPPSPKTGESWEKYAFWPPYSNSLSAGVFLHRILTATATAAIEIAVSGIVTQNSPILPQLRSLVNEVRERSITAICAAWLNDSENCRELEDWARSGDRKDLTNMPGRLSAFEMAILDDLQMLVYLPNVQDSSGRGIVSGAPRSVIETIQRTFKSSLYKSLSAIMEHAAKSSNSDDNVDLTTPSSSSFGAGARDDIAAPSNTNVRQILTMSNLSHLRSDTIPKLCTHFETTFSTSLVDDLKSLRDTLHQMHSRVFQAYVRPTVDHLRQLITSGIITPAYAPANPTTIPNDARPYVYEVLLTLVLVHAEVSSTAPPLTSQILGTLFEQISAAYLHAFKQRQRYSLAALMQATLDVEFTSQTLHSYTTDKVADVQGQIYMALDERTDNEARLKLQTELPQMRAVLKRLREGTRGSFGCFKKEKRRDKEGREGRRDG